MCGIAGIVNFDGRPVDTAVLGRMTRVLQHRGPDGEGIHIGPDQGYSVGLGHRRLAVIDVSDAAAQPMANEDGKVWITYNGEVYNYKELREELIRSGHVFRSESDTEVILHGYEEFGCAVVSKLNGMFAFAIWDGRNGRLLLARDRYGKKPLYYRLAQDDLIFASELKSLFMNPAVSRDVDLCSLSRYLLHEYVPAPHTIIKGVAKLPAGCCLMWKGGCSSVFPYWNLDFQGRCRDIQTIAGDAKDMLLHLLKESVRRRLQSDVPLGVFLSGGIDSSCIVAMMAELMPADQIKTFSIGFDEKSFDESSYAREVAELFGTDHHEKKFTHKDMLETLPEIWNIYDEPFADASALPTYMLSKFAREHVTVALGGDGSDEIFAGYDPFLAHKAADLYHLVPKIVHERIIAPAAGRLPVSTDNIAFDFKIKQFLKGARFDAAVRNQVWLGSFDAEEQKSLFHPDAAAMLNGFTPYAEIEDSCRTMAFRDATDRMIYLYLHYYLADDILTKVDRAGMAASLEVRAPFLDTELTEFVNGLDTNLKLKRFTRKYILKNCLKDKLPHHILHRKKKGFGIPLAAWFKKELRPVLHDAFSPQRIKNGGFFRHEAVDRLLDDHFEGRKDNRKQIWTLFMFEMWKDRFAA